MDERGFPGPEPSRYSPATIEVPLPEGDPDSEWPRLPSALLALAVASFGLRTDAEDDLHLLLDLRHHGRVVAQVPLRVLTSLPALLAVVAVPRARLLDDPVLRTDVDEERGVRDALGVHDVELRLLERRRDLVLHDLHPDVRADHVLLLLHRADAPDVEPQRRVELERLSAGRRLRVAEHDADLLAQLVAEDHRGLRARNGASQLPERLTHEARLEADVRIAHVALDFGLRHERGDGVDDDDVHRPGAHEDLADLERLLAGVRLR